MAVFLTPFTNAEPETCAYFVHISSTSLEGETNYYASNQETYFKKSISSLFIIVTLKSVPQFCDNIESNVICA